VSGLGTSFAFGAASNYPRDLANSDCILIMGSNMAESRPVSFHWPVLAQHRGSVLIHVDPRYTRTSAVADVFVKIRPGTDIAFLGGIIRYILEHERYFKEYVVHYTNAATLIADEYRHEEEAGLFAGFNPSTGTYDLIPGAWEYMCEPGPHGARGLPRTDPTLQNPACVLQILKRHYARYTPQAVSRVCGCRPEDVIKVAELLCRNSGRERTSAIAYALGWTQHSTGSQMIRAAAIIQLLLGNVGRPGGGVLALRGHACIQGATDIPVLFDMLPGYLPQPRAVLGHTTLAQYLSNGRSYLTTEFENVFIQPDICNGCSSCVAACLFGVITRSSVDGHSHKCTLCYDRQRDGLVPACAKACPTRSIQFGPIDELRERARGRVEDLHKRGVTNAYLFGDTPSKSYSELNSFYLLVDRPSVYGLPDNPFNPWMHMKGDYVRAIVSGLTAIAALLAVLLLLGN
jgi:ferredoxin